MGQPAVPLVSRWSMAERASGAVSLGQVQYVFLELPKLRDRVLTNAVERWAAIFVSAPVLDPAQMAKEPLTAAQREALERHRDGEQLRWLYEFHQRSDIRQRNGFPPLEPPPARD